MRDAGLGLLLGNRVDKDRFLFLYTYSSGLARAGMCRGRALSRYVQDRVVWHDNWAIKNSYLSSFAR